MKIFSLCCLALLAGCAYAPDDITSAFPPSGGAGTPEVCPSDCLASNAQTCQQHGLTYVVAWECDLYCASQVRGEQCTPFAGNDQLACCVSPWPVDSNPPSVPTPIVIAAKIFRVPTHNKLTVGQNNHISIMNDVRANEVVNKGKFLP
jgi:hypothetical protein